MSVTASLSGRESSVLDAVPSGLSIGGQWRDASDGATIPVEDPSTGEVLTHVPDAAISDGTALPGVIRHL